MNHHNIEEIVNEILQTNIDTSIIHLHIQQSPLVGFQSIQITSDTGSSAIFGTVQQDHQHLLDYTQTMNQMHQLIDQLQLPDNDQHLTSTIQVEAFFHHILEADSSDENEVQQGSHQHHQTPIVMKDSPTECYVCLIESQQFNETCGEVFHQICSTCYNKINHVKGCPMCRKDLVGITGHSTILAFFNSTTVLYEQLYNYYNALPNGNLRFRATASFGEFEQKEEFIALLKQKCLLLVNEIYSDQSTEFSYIHIELLKKIINESTNNQNPYLYQLASLLTLYYEI